MVAGADESSTSGVSENLHGSPSMQFWAYTFYVLGAFPAMVALLTSVVANIVYFTQPASSQCDWFPVYLRFAASPYAYLLLYLWMMVGPVPFRKRLGMKLLKYLMGIIFTAACGVNGFGMWVITTYSNCGTTKGPRDKMNFLASAFLMALFSLFAFSTLVHFISIYVSARAKAGSQSKMKALEERVRREMEAQEGSTWTTTTKKKRKIKKQYYSKYISIYKRVSLLFAFEKPTSSHFNCQVRAA